MNHRSTVRSQDEPNYNYRRAALRDGERVGQRTQTTQDNTSPNAIALVFWIALWVLNGASTAAPFVLIGRSGFWLGIGICVHLIVSLIETRLWRSLRRCAPAEKAAIAL